MSRVCDVCGKTKQAGNKVTFSHRAIRRTWTPNLRRVRVYDENGTPKRLNVCTRCLRSGNVNRNRPVDSFLTEEVEVEAILTEEVADEVAEAVTAEEVPAEDAKEAEAESVETTTEE